MILFFAGFCSNRSSFMAITKDTLIGEALEQDIELAQFFFEIGMHCLGCASRMETIEQACAVHNTDCDALLKKINDYLASKN